MRFGWHIQLSAAIDAKMRILTQAPANITRPVHYVVEEIPSVNILQHKADVLRIFDVFVQPTNILLHCSANNLSEMTHMTQGLTDRDLSLEQCHSLWVILEAMLHNLLQDQQLLLT